ncbi:MAG: hypothetical protein NE328_15080 [Lentisphaeraceae bacterium]|nr:hypothetical protein [Lentisphaeraceae bacterium]
MVENVIPEVNEVVCNMIKQMFGQYFNNDNSNYNEVNIPPCDDYMVFIKINGSKKEGELILSTDETTATNLLQLIGITLDGNEIDSSLTESALSELANVVAGELMTCPSFIETFGQVNILPPRLWNMKSSNNEEGCIPINKGFSSAVLKGREVIFTYISCIEPNQVQVNIRDLSDEDISGPFPLVTSNN